MKCNICRKELSHEQQNNGQYIMMQNESRYTEVIYLCDNCLNKYVKKKKRGILFSYLLGIFLVMGVFADGILSGVDGRATVYIYLVCLCAPYAIRNAFVSVLNEKNRDEEKIKQIAERWQGMEPDEYNEKMGKHKEQLHSKYALMYAFAIIFAPLSIMLTISECRQLRIYENHLGKSGFLVATIECIVEIVLIVAIAAFIIAFIRVALGHKGDSQTTQVSTITEGISYSSISESNDEQERLDYSDQYFLPDSNTRYYTDEEVCDWDYITLRNAINEVYARHGDVFNETGRAPELQPLQEHFESCDWYTPIYGKSDEECYSEFNEYELANTKLFNYYKKMQPKP